MLAADDEAIIRLAAVISDGDIDGLGELLHQRPDVARQRHGDEQMSRTALHVATDWPGRYPNVRASIELLIAHGAPVDGRFHGPHRETPLHWAASSDDVDAIDALLDAGADIEADGGVLTNGSPLDDAVVFAQWSAARLLVRRHARVLLWHAAALGLTEHVRRLLDGPGVTPAEITNAAWHGCRAGSAEAVALLVDRGADLDLVLYDGQSARQAAVRHGGADLLQALTEQP